MISQTAEYALRAVVFLAEQEGKSCTIQQIAESTKVPAGYLSKVMQGLARQGLVFSQRGLRGGFSLARDPKDMTIYEVVQAVDPIARITRCPLDNPAHANHLCGLHRRLDEAAALVEKAFRECALEDLVHNPSFSESR